MTPSRYITVPQAAELLGVSPRTGNERLIDEGSLDAHRPHKQLRVAADSRQAAIGRHFVRDRMRSRRSRCLKTPSETRR